MTWFTRTLYRDVGVSLSEPEAMFESVASTIRAMEIERGMPEEQWSHPRFHLGERMKRWLDRRFLR